MVRVITVVADETEGAVKGTGTAEATEIVAAKTAVPAQVMGIAAVIRAAEMPAVAAKAVGALELAIIRVPGIVAAPAKSMEAEAALVPKAPGAQEAQAIRPATTAAANLGEHRLQHPRP